MKHHELTKLAAALCFAVLCALSTTATSQNLGYCDPGTETCDCSSSWAQNHDACQTQTLAQVSDPYTDYGDIQNYANINAGWESGDLYVNADFTDHRVMVIGVPSNNGEWESIGELNNYLSNLLGVTVDVSTNAGSFEIHYEQKGTFARWDGEKDEWAANQTNGNLLFAAITGADGHLKIGDYEIELNYNNNCTTATSGSFSGKQCTTVVELKTYTCTAAGGCGGCIPPDCTHNLLDDVESRIFEFTNESFGLYYDAFADPNFTWGYRRVRVLADEADMQNFYYDLGGNYALSSPDYPSVDYNTDASSSSATQFHGACGFGQAARGMDTLGPITSNGTAPLTPTACESDRDSL